MWGADTSIIHLTVPAYANANNTQAAHAHTHEHYRKKQFGLQAFWGRDGEEEREGKKRGTEGRLYNFHHLRVIFSLSGFNELLSLLSVSLLKAAY